LNYRAEIDGLRALAVVPVILFHAGFELFSGGFVGVDVFFVISGYLITTILIEDLENKRFRVVNFFERRARRILPALYFVLLIITIVSTLLMNAQQLKDYGQSLIATVSFTSNIYFLLKADYWAQSSEFLPLLHTWSLAIEEQYYVVFPIMLSFIWRYGQSKTFWIIVGMSLTSLILSEWGSRNLPLINFYFSLTRVWELLFGSIAALLVYRKSIRKNDPLAFLGLSLILFPIFVYDDLTPFPSFYSLAPVVGVFLFILFAHKESLVARFLSFKLFVGVGLISYSAYLWHQPLLAIFRVHQNSIEINLASTFLILVTTFFIAFLSYRYVERPFRNKELVSTKVLIYFSILPLLIFLLYGAYLHKTEGMRYFKMSLVSSESRELFNKREIQGEKRSVLWKKLLREAKKPFNDNNKLKLLFIGDSISEDLFVVTKSSEELLSRVDPRVLPFDDLCAKHIVTKKKEINYPGLINLHFANDKLCSDSIKSYLDSDLFTKSDIIVIATMWLSNASYLKDLLNHSLLTDKKIIVYKTHAFSHMASIIMSLKLGQNDSISEIDKFVFHNKRSRVEFANSIINKIALANNISTLNGFDAFCDSNKEECNLFDELGNPLILDQSHLTVAGVGIFEEWFSENFINLIENNLNK
jgi:peptidoglycan/LPS O-acetylase OafA/YrhL